MRTPPPLRTALRWGARLTVGALALAAVTAAGGYTLTERRAHARVAVPEHAFAVPAGDAAVARGRRLATVRGCVECHGEHLGGRVLLDQPAIGRLAGANLTAGRPGGPLSDADWERAVRHGVRRDGTSLLFMPSKEFAGFSDEDLGAIAAYARTLPAVRAAVPASRVGPVIRGLSLAGKVNVLSAAEIDHRRPHPARVAAAPTAAYGAYLAAGCTGCHGDGLGGGPIPGTPPEWKPAANITPAGIGHYTEADFFRALRTGRRPGGAPIDTTMPWRLLREMDDVELRALYAYLRTVPSKPYGTR